MRSMLLAAVTVACCSVAQAQNPARGWYVGFDAGMSRLDGELDDRDNQVTLPFDDDSATFAAHAGYRFNRVLQLGVFYADYGNSYYGTPYSSPYYGYGGGVVVEQRYIHGGTRYHRGTRDRDRDGVPNRYDRDRDGDGVSNRRDAYPNDPRRR